MVFGIQGFGEEVPPVEETQFLQTAATSSVLLFYQPPQFRLGLKASEGPKSPDSSR